MATAHEIDLSHNPLEAFALERGLRPGLPEITLGLLHRFNNAVTGVGFLAEQGASALESGHPARKDLEEIGEVLRKAQHFLDLIVELHLAEPSEPAYFALDALLDRQMEIVRALLAKGTSVQLQAPAGMLVRVSEPLFRQALLHLVQNAREAMDGGRHPSLRISVALEEPWGAIKIRDNGAGIAAAMGPRIFEPFVTHKDPAKHAGVGAFLAKRIAANCGWELSAQNHPEGGAEFTLRLPLESSGE